MAGPHAKFGDETLRETAVSPAVPIGRSAHLKTISPTVVVLAAILAILVIPPLVYLVRASLFTTDFLGRFENLTLSHFVKTFNDPNFYFDFYNTIIYSAGSAIFAIAFGFVVASVAERTNTPFRKYVIAVSIISLGTPHVLYTIAWILVLGRSGPVNVLLMSVLHLSDPVLSPNSMPGMIFIEGLSWTPLAYLLLSAVLRSADPSLEEASMTSGAGVLQSFRRVTLPLCMPAILALFLLVFVRAFESFEVPMLVGSPGGVNVLATDIYVSITSKIPPDFGQSAAFSVVLLVFVMFLLHWYGSLTRRSEKYQTITGKGFRPRLIELGRTRYLAAGVLVAFVFLVVVAPLGMVVWTALLPYYAGFSLASVGRMSLSNFALVAGSGSFRDSILNTILLGIGAATVTSALAAACGWLVVRRAPGAWILDQLASFPLVFPAIVLGVAFLQIFVNTPFGLYGSLLSLVIASSVLYLPYGMRYAYAGALQIHVELEEASKVAGAAGAATFRRIVVPLLLPAIVTSWLLVFLVSARAVSLPLLLAGPNSQVVAVTLFDLWNNGQINEVAAMGAAWAGLMTVVSLCLFVVSRRFGLAVR